MRTSILVFLAAASIAGLAVWMFRRRGRRQADERERPAEVTMSEFLSTLSGPDNLSMKVGRAYTHLKEFDSLVVKYCRSMPFEMTQHDDLESGLHVRRCELLPMPGEIPLSLADVVYNLRSGLDQLVWSLVPSPGKWTMFPVEEVNNSAARKSIKEKLGDMPDAMKQIILDLQPYHWGDRFREDPLWQLNALGNIDKHRIPTGRSNDLSIRVHPAAERTELENGVQCSWPIGVKGAVVFEPSAPTLTFGDPLDRPTSETPVEITREQIFEIYRYVLEVVGPKFGRPAA